MPQPDTATIDTTTPPASTTPLTVRCPKCKYEATKSAEGWGVLALAESGLPYCPTDGVEMDPVVGDINLRPLAAKIAENAEQVDAARRSTEPQLEPVNGKLPFPAPKFDAVAALHAIDTQRREVQSIRSRWEALKERTKQTREDLDEQSEALEKLIADYHERLDEAERVAREPYLEAVDETKPEVPETEREISETTATVGETNEPEPEAPSKRAHIAGAPGDTYQSCTECGCILRDQDGNIGVMNPWPAGAEVGDDCDGIQF